MKYKILFSIEFLHDYYITNRSNDFEVIPTQQTQKQMKGLGLLSKMIANQFVVLIPVDADDKPFKKLSQEDVWRFYVQLKNNRFINITNASVALSSRSRYYFNNLNQNEADSLFYLSKEIPAYSSSADYVPADFAVGAGGNLFEALRSSSNANQHPTTETAFWLNRGNKQFVSKDDLIVITNSVYVFKSSAPAISFTIKVFKLNISNGLFDIPVLQTSAHTSSAVNSISINLENLQSAKYRIDVNGESKFVYYDNTAVHSGVFAIIDIYNHLAPSNDFSLLDNNGVVKEKKFSLRFANRLTLWKYRTRTNDVTSIDDSIAAHVFTQSAPLEFISNRQIPISETPVKTLSLTSTKLGKVNAIVNPDAERLNTVVKDGDSIFCTEVYLNY